MKDRKLATRYARALLSALPDDDTQQKAAAFLTALADAMERSPDLRDVLLNPAYSRAQRRAVLDGIADSYGAPAKVKSFLGVVNDQGRAGHLPSIAIAYRDALEEAAGIVAVTVDAAMKMSADQEATTKTTLEKVTGRRVRLTVNIEPSLIGGAVARVGSRVYDGSLKTQLNLLRRRMSEG
ncbi:MAG: ATP synthase F1 subunit delta [Acidobacteriota bacterium]|nr:ATP synthase F1 subunit delta [Acidobacteriota bacterium]